MRTLTAILTFITSLSFSAGAGADSTRARCDIYPRGEDHTEVMIACDFGQRQGNVTISHH